MSVFSNSLIFRNAYKLVPLLVLGYGLSKGVGRGKSLFSFSSAISVQTEVNNIARRIQQTSMMGDPVPTPETFAEFVHANFQQTEGVNRDQAIDFWGQPYVLTIDGAVARVISAGPDRKLGTADDIVAEARLVPAL